MLIKDLPETLKNLTNLKKITQEDIGNALGIGRSTVNIRMKNNSPLGYDERKKIEEYFRISLSDSAFSHFTNKLKPYTRVGITGFGKRFNKMQAENDLNDTEMSKILKISESRVEKLGLGLAVPTLDDLNSIKSNFDVSIDWLLYDA